MITRLAPDKYPLLKGIYDGFVPDPKHSIALIATEAEEIVGRVFLLEPVHLEGPWVKESRRGSTIGKRLIESAEEEAKRVGITKLFAYAVDATMADYLERLGFQRNDWIVYTKDI